MEKAKKDPGRIQKSGSECPTWKTDRAGIGFLGVEISAGDVGVLGEWCSECLAAKQAGKEQCAGCGELEGRVARMLTEMARKAEAGGGTPGGGGLFGGAAAPKGDRKAPAVERKDKRKGTGRR